MPNLQCGIVGLPNVGKSTLFNALTKKGAPAANYPFCTIDPNVGIVDVPDERLLFLAEQSHSQKIVPATVAFVDIAGLVQGASQGEGLGNQFLGTIREADAIALVVRCFDSEDVIHVAGKVDPLADIEVIHLELALSDLQMADQIAKKMEKQLKSKKELIPTFEVLQKAVGHLNQGKALRMLSLSAEENLLLKAYPFLTNKRVLYIANVSESSLPSMDNPYVKRVRDHAQAEGGCVVPICAKLEEELAHLSFEEAREFLEGLGLAESGLSRLVKATFDMLDLITFITTGEMETRAWTITRGTTAQEAAGKIHGDIQKGFIRAEVVSFLDMMAYKGRVGAREAGKARSEGKDYIMQDGDVVLFFHN